jgi:hypothetical protein
MEKENIIEFVKENIIPLMKWGQTWNIEYEWHKIKVYYFAHATEITIDNEKSFEI